MCRIGGQPEIFASSFKRLAQKTVGRPNCKNKKWRVSVLPPSQRPYLHQHDTRTNRIILTGNPAASLSLDRCGVDAVRRACVPRRLNPPHGLRPPHTCMPHDSCARSPAPSDERPSSGNRSGRTNRPLHWKRASARVPGEGRGPDSAHRADTQPWGNAQALSPLIPTNVGIQGGRRTVSHLAASIPYTRGNRSRIPTAHPEPVEGRQNEWSRLHKIRLT